MLAKNAASYLNGLEKKLLEERLEYHVRVYMYLTTVSPSL
jgi:hypothetical protein